MTDTIDFAWTLQTALFALIEAAVAPVKVVDALPLDEVLPENIVYFGPHTVTDLGSKDSPYEQHQPTIHVMGQGSSRKAVRLLQARIKASLDRQSVTADGVLIDDPVEQSSTCEQVDASVYLGTQTFLTFVQASG